MLRLWLSVSRGRRVSLGLAVCAVLIAKSILALSEERSGREIIQANAVGTGPEHDTIHQDKNKSTGVLYPFAKLVLDEDKRVSLDLNRNPWELVNIDAAP